MKRYIKITANAEHNSRSLGSLPFPSNMTYLSIVTPDYKTIWEGEAYDVYSIPSGYCGLKVVDKYRAGDPDDPNYGESYVVVVDK